MGRTNHYHWDQIKEEIILLCIQWYVSYSLTYEQLKKVMEQRGFKIDPRTINRLIKEYSIMAKKRQEETERKRRRGWRLVQIPFKIRGRKKYLYRALDAQGNTLDFIIFSYKNKDKAYDFFRQTISINPELNHNKIIKKGRDRREKRDSIILSIAIIIILIILGNFILDNFPFTKEVAPPQIEENNNVDS